MKKYWLRNGVDQHGLFGIKVVTKNWFGWKILVKNPNSFSDIFFDMGRAQSFVRARMGVIA